MNVVSELYEWVHDGIDVYVAHCKYQVKPQSSPWFSAACAAAIIHRNNFFCLCQQNKSSESKEKIRKASNSYKSVLEAARLAYAIKMKESIACQKLGSLSICLIANSVLNKSKSAIPQASAYEKQGRATIGCLIMKFRGYGRVKSCMPPTK